MSLTEEIVSLKVGEAYAKTRFIPGNTPNLGRVIKDAKRKMLQLLSPSLARARNHEPDAVYSLHGIHAFTTGYDVIVSAVVVREELAL